MFSFSTKNKANVESFSLFWRWNQSCHALLSDEELALIEPLSASKAFELHELLMPIGESLADRSASSISSESPQAKMWLQGYLAKDEFIFLSWDKFTAVRVPSSLFICRSDDFCYPSSDDIFIYPESGSYLLQFHHFEVFTWDKL